MFRIRTPFAIVLTCVALAAGCEDNRGKVIPAPTAKYPAGKPGLASTGGPVPEVTKAPADAPKKDEPKKDESKKEEPKSTTAPEKK